jgi:hypothetical protein
LSRFVIVFIPIMLIFSGSLNLYAPTRTIVVRFK